MSKLDLLDALSSGDFNEGSSKQESKSIQFPDNNKKSITDAEGEGQTPQKAIKSDKDTGDDALTDAFWNDYLKNLDNYSQPESQTDGVRVHIDRQLIDTLKMIKDVDYRNVINAIVKTFILTYKSKLRRNLVSKPKTLL